jgi:hypothetical protein
VEVEEEEEEEEEEEVGRKMKAATKEGTSRLTKDRNH